MRLRKINLRSVSVTHMHKSMTPLQYIRLYVFRVDQPEMAKILGVNQSTIWKWESPDPEKRISITEKNMRKYREAAKERELPFHDSWFFETPKDVA